MTHLINRDGDTICGAEPYLDGSNVTTDRALFSCSECRATFSERINALKNKTMNDVLEYGHQVIGVFDNDDPAGYLSYSVGRCVLGKPEFVTTGPIPLSVSQHMINEATRLMDDDLPVKDGYEFLPDTLLEGYSVKVVQVDPTKYELNHIYRTFGEQPNLEVMQLLWPDMEGHFPDDPAYTGPAQPIHPLEGSTA